MGQGIIGLEADRFGVVLQGAIEVALVGARKARSNIQAVTRSQILREGRRCDPYLQEARHDVTDYVAHRLAWLYMTGEWPRHEIDQINLDRSDNRFCNLRPANRSQNSANSTSRASQIKPRDGIPDNWPMVRHRGHSRGDRQVVRNIEHKVEGREASGEMEQMRSRRERLKHHIHPIVYGRKVGARGDILT